MNSVREIIDNLGGPGAVAKAAETSVWAVHKWGDSGIPEKHWAAILKLGSVTPEDLHRVNEACRAIKAGSAA